MSLKQESQNKAFGGTLTKYSFASKSLGGLETKFNVFMPAEGEKSKVPVLYYLAGLTCTEDTGPQKSHLLAPAAQHGIAIVFPDTSPRGAKIEGEDADWDFGTGAGFYLNASSEKWSGHYNMEKFVVEELRGIVQSELSVDPERTSIFGHSMGGHGALSLYLKYPGQYKSASGFAPICNPTECQWGQKAFKGYLSDPSSEGPKHDSTHLIASYPKDEQVAIKVDYGTGDKFYQDGQLLPENFEKAVRDAGREGEVEVGRREGYDHSYFFISTFAAEHVEFHAKYLKA